MIRCATCFGKQVHPTEAMACKHQYCVARTQAIREQKSEQAKQWAAEREQEAKEIEIFRPDYYDSWAP